MPSTYRRKDAAVIDQLLAAGPAFTFVQAVRLIEQSAACDTAEQDEAEQSALPIGGFAPPARELIRFASHQSLAFPPAELKRISMDRTQPHWRVLVQFFGLTGAMGVLPHHYTELVLQRQKLKDPNLEDFLNLFNHRLISLFHAACCKYHLPLQYERHQRIGSHRQPHDQITRALLAVTGLGLPGQQNRLYTRDESVLRFAGLFAQKVRNSSNLRRLLSAHFSIPVRIEQFIGQWQQVIDDVRSRLPDRNNPVGRNVRLGHSVMLGRRGWHAQSRIRIILGPLDRQQLERFAPGTDSLRALNELVRLYLGLEYDYQFVIRIHEKDKPPRINLNKQNPPVLGWNSWLTSKRKKPTRSDSIVDIRMSASRLN